jgi:sialate O-acetylesterase
MMRTLLALLALTALLRAEVKLPAVISDHMVLQARAGAAIWGWAEAGEEVTVAIADHRRTTKAAADGKWMVTLDKLEPSSEPRTLTVQGRNTLTVQDVLVGEVWLAAGQSNMEMTIKDKLHGSVDRADEEIAEANFPQIRVFVHDAPFSIYETRVPPAEPLADRPGQWRVCSPETVADFSAIGYFFARELHTQLREPIGILTAAVGGTPIEAWTSLAVQQSAPPLQPLLADWQERVGSFDPAREQQEFLLKKAAWLKQRSAAVKLGEPPPKAPAPFKNVRVTAPGGLFNGVIAPLVPYTIRGCIWYQGERNSAGPFTSLYGLQLRTLITDWRARWGTEFYFAWMQLPRFQKEQRAPSEPNGWGVAVRDEMRKTLAVPATGMAITIDLGGEKEGHPTNKADYAARLSPLVLHDVHGQQIPIRSGPLFRTAQRNGDKIEIAFDHAQGLKPASGELEGFAIAGADQKFVWAKASVAGEKVMVWSETVKEPAAVRYAWAANPKCNLVNAAGLPASPFRTDDWK